MHATPEHSGLAQSLPVAYRPHRDPTAVDQSQVGRPSIAPSCLGIFSAPDSAKISRVGRSLLVSTSSHFSLATPGPVCGPFTRLRRCNSAVHSGLCTTPVPFRLDQSPLVADLRHQALTPIGSSVLPRRPLWSPGFDRSFQRLSSFSQTVALSLTASQAVGVSPLLCFRSLTSV